MNSYHTDISALSSSMLKLLRKDPAEFKRQYIDGERDNSPRAHFLEGTYCHSLLLEPETIKDQYAFYTGGIKRGNDWKAFVEANAGKTILSAPEKMRSEKYAASASARPEVLKMLQNGIAEHTMYSEVMGVPVKKRSDYINLEAGYIVDVKTTAQPADAELFKYTVQQYDYDLSAALYCQIAHNLTGKLFDFYWVVISKQDLVCDIYKASSDTLSTGASKVTQALYLYKKCTETGLWQKDHRPTFDSKQYEILEV